MESHQFATEAESGTALGLEPLGRVSSAGLLTGNGLGKATLLGILVESLSNLLGAMGREGENISVSLVVESCNLPVEVLRPLDSFVARLSAWEFEHHLSCLEVGDHSAIVAS